MKMLRSAFVTALLHVHLRIQSVHSVLCYDCIGTRCTEGSCSGDLCFVSEYTPSWGSAVNLGASRYVKGCTIDSDVSDQPFDFCESVLNSDGTQTVKSCFCNSTDYCNTRKYLAKAKMIKTEPVRCFCDGFPCEGNTCQGDYCSTVTDVRTGKSVRGCLTNPIRLLQYSGIDACFRPPLGGLIGSSGQGHSSTEDLLSYESCLCAENYCNEKLPRNGAYSSNQYYPVNPVWPSRGSLSHSKFLHGSDRRYFPGTCDLNFDTYLKHGNEKSSEKQTCQGDLCYYTKLNVSDKVSDIFRGYMASGCMKLTEDAKTPKVPGETCFSVLSSGFNISHCMTSAQVERSVPQDYSTPLQKWTAQFMTPADGTRATPTTSTPTGEPETGAEGGEEDEGGESSNTKAVAVFILIVFVVFGGLLLWKLKLHQRFFRAKYESVA